MLNEKLDGYFNFIINAFEIKKGVEGYERGKKLIDDSYLYSTPVEYEYLIQKLAEYCNV